MVRRILIVVALMGCGGGEGGDAHVLTACASGAWKINGQPITHCQVACAAGGAPSDDTDGNGVDDRCEGRQCQVGFYVEFGVGGCCEVRDLADLGTPNVILDFHECE